MTFLQKLQNTGCIIVLGIFLLFVGLCTAGKDISEGCNFYRALLSNKDEKFKVTIFESNTTKLLDSVKVTIISSSKSYYSRNGVVEFKINCSPRSTKDTVINLKFEKQGYYSAHENTKNGNPMMLSPIH
jgi:hypothetical protein